MRPSSITDGISGYLDVRAVLIVASMRPSSITDGIQGREFIPRHSGHLARFNEAVEYYRRNPEDRTADDHAAESFNEAVEYYRRNHYQEETIRLWDSELQ